MSSPFEASDDGSLRRPLNRLHAERAIAWQVPFNLREQAKLCLAHQLTYTLADSKCGGSFLAFLVTLLLAYAGKKIRLVCDNGRFHTTKAVQAFLEEHREQIEVYWLPPYCPSLNLIERLWGHLKRTVIANVLYATLNDLVAAFRKGARRLTGNRERMGFMFDHDDVAQKSPRRQSKIAA